MMISCLPQNAPIVKAGNSEVSFSALIGYLSFENSMFGLTIKRSTQIARIHWPFIGPSDAARLAHGCKY